MNIMHKKLLRYIPYKKCSRIFSRALNLMKHHPLMTMAFLLTAGSLAAFQLIACESTSFTHGTGIHCNDIDPRALINSKCTPDPPPPPRIDDGVIPRPKKDRARVDQIVQTGKVDILFVVDNSSSMHEEHLNIADQFSRFLDDIEDLDYRIAITTVDISSSPGNSKREYQDGRFIEFDDRSIFLHNNEETTSKKRRRHRKNERFFIEAIVREETKDCDSEDSDLCPTDERAICALNKALSRREERRFFRDEPDVHLMIIIISDEDERSSEDFINRQLRSGNDYSFESCDYPDTFFINVYNKIGPTKGYSVHSIIIPTDDSRCLASQEHEKGVGYPGETYEELSEPTSRMMDRHPGLNKGSIISICDRSYADQLGVLSRYLRAPQPVTLPCDSNDVAVKINSKNIDHRVEGRKVIIEDEISLDSQLSITYKCS